MKTLPVLLMSLVLPLMALAQETAVWRCGQGNTYSTTPCPEGRAVVAASDSRPAGDVRAAREVAEREARLAESLRQERLQREAVAPGAGLAGLRTGAAAVKPGPAEKPAKKSKKAQPQRKASSQPDTDDQTWRAVAPASRRKPG